MSVQKHEYWISQAGLTVVRGLAREGLTNEQMCERIGITPQSFYKWQKRFPEFKEAIDRGREPVLEEVIDSAYNAAKGQWVEEVDTHIVQMPDGSEKKEVTKHKRYIPPNTALICYILNNRRGETWCDKGRSNRAVLESDTRDVLVINLERKNNLGDNAAKPPQANEGGEQNVGDNT